MKKISALEDHLGYWMRFVSNHVSLSFSKKLEQYDIGVGEWVVLRNLQGDVIHAAILAEKTGMTRGAISKLLDRLVKKELIIRVESSKDRRYQEIRLSEKGTALVPKLAALADMNDTHFFGHLSDAQKENLIHIFKEMVALHQIDQTPIN